MRRLLLILLLSLPAAAQVWTQPTLNSTTNIGSKGFNQGLPYDTYRHELLWYSSCDPGVDTSIYSNCIVGYNAATHTFNGRAYNGASGDSQHVCPSAAYGGNGLDVLRNPGEGHPSGFFSYDTRLYQAVLTMQLCSQYNAQITYRYDSASTAMLSPLPIYYAGAGGHYGTGQNDLYTVFVRGTTSAGDKHVLFYNGGFYYWHPGDASWTTAAVTGTLPPFGAYNIKLFYNPNDGFMYMFGGSTYPASPSTSFVDVYRVNTSNWTVTKIAVSGGPPPTTYAAYPSAVLDTRRNRIIYYAAAQILWQFDIASSTWSTLTASGTGPTWTDACEGNATSRCHSAWGYDPDNDKMVGMVYTTQGGVPAVYELTFDDWNSGTTYAKGAQASVSGITYVSLQDNNVNHAPASNPTWWIVFSNLTTLTVQELTVPAINSALQGIVTGPPQPKAITGTDRSSDIVIQGVPLLDSWNISGTAPQLAMSGTSAAQFDCLMQWPSGHCKHVLISTLGTFTANGSQSFALTTGAGNIGGNNLVTDNNNCSGSNSNYVCVNTGIAQFAIKKANHNVIDSAVVNGTTIVPSGASSGIVVSGPAADGSTVSCARPPTGCTTLYMSANDASSTLSVLRNGPVSAVVYVQGSLVNGSESYLHYGEYLYFTKGKSGVKIDYEIRNARETHVGATDQAFVSAGKQFSGLDVRLALTMSGTKAAAFSTDASTTSYTFSSTEGAYKFQGFSSRMQDDESPWMGQSLISRTGSAGNYTYALDGLKIYQSGSSTPLYSVDRQHYDDDFWADVNDASGRGVLASVFEGDVFWPKSVGFSSGGTEVRVGLWPAQSQWLENAGAAIPYTLPYAQYWKDSLYFGFHDAALRSQTAEARKFQVPLAMRATRAHYNATGVFPLPLTDPAEATSYMNNVARTITPAGTWTATPSDYAPAKRDYWGWNAPGGNNQTDTRWDILLQWYRGENFPGRIGWARNFYKHIMERGLPRATGFRWTDHFVSYSGDLNSMGYPSGLTSTGANNSIGWDDWCEGLHCHIYGLVDWYLFTGDPSVKQFMENELYDHFSGALCNNSSWSNSTQGGWYTCQEGDASAMLRGLGTQLMAATRLHQYFAAPGPTNNATKAADLYTTQEREVEFLRHDFKVSGYGDNTNHWPRGISYVRGVPYAHQLNGNWILASNPGDCNAGTYAITASNYASYGMAYPPSMRSQQPLQVSIFLQGLKEMLLDRGTGYADYQLLRDRELGATQWALFELTHDDGSGKWQNGTYTYNGQSYPLTPNGIRHNDSLEYTANPAGTQFSHGGLCEAQVSYASEQTSWFLWSEYIELTGDTSVHNTMDHNLRRLLGNGPNLNDPNLGFYDAGGYNLANAINSVLHPPSTRLQTVNITSFSNNGGGSYTLHWAEPAGVSRYRLKYSSKQLVDWLGFNIDTGSDVPNCDAIDPAANCVGGTWQYSPATYAPWFSASYAPTQPVATNTTITVTGLPTGLTAANFMLKAFVTQSGPSDIIPPSVYITSPASGATMAGTVVISANAFDNVGVVGVQFKLDGSNLGAETTATPYSAAWDTSSAATGLHVLTAVATDAAGNAATSSPVTVTVSTAGATPLTVSITAPVPNASLSGSVNVQATPSDNAVVAGVQFLLDGTNLGTEVTVSPYIVTWNTTSAANGSHVLAARVHDISGSQNTSSPVTVTVSNGSGATSASAVLGIAVDSNTTFEVREDGLDSVLACPKCYFSGSADLIHGQTTEIRVRPGTGTPLIADRIILRQGAVNGRVVQLQGPNFVLQPSDAALQGQNVIVTTGTVTLLDGITSTGNLQVGHTVAVRGLLLKSSPLGGPTLIAKRIKLLP